jgi:hypothetical protein
MNITEEQFKIWAQAPSATKYITTRARIERALKDKFGSKIDVYLQGSYKNSTNVRSESDVDIIVEYTPAYYPGFFGVSDEEQAKYYREIHSPHDYNFPQFKDDVESVLQTEFSTTEVQRGDKAIKVLKNDYRVNADIIACFTHKRYISYSDFDPAAVGIHFFTDKGVKVVNFPNQHHQNGEDKNHPTRTNGKYKDMVRIYKNINYKLIDEGRLTDKEIPSHFIECLVWNVPDIFFKKSSYSEILKTVTAVVWADMDTKKDPHNSYSYVHDLVWLFKGNSEYTPQLAEKFMSSVWSFAGF